MNRGATPYGLRGTPLVLPNGTLDNPAIRLGRERTGLYRSADGAMSLGLKKVRAAEFSQGGLAIFSDSPGDGLVSPLSLARNNATTADGQETALDTYEVGVPVARQSVFRESVGVYGFKWYGRSGGALHATPAMALSGDKDLAIGRDLGVTRNLLVSGNSLTIRPTTGAAGFTMSPVTSDQHSQITLSVNNTWNLYIALQATTSGFLSNNVADANIYTPAPGGRLLLGAYGQSRIIMDSGQTRFFGDGLDLAALVTSGTYQGRWRLGGSNITPYSKLHIETQWNGDGITIGTNNGNGQGISFNNNVGGPLNSNSILYLFSNQGATGWQGGAWESGLYTSGAQAGALLLGGQDVIRLRLNQDSIRFTSGGTEHAQMNNGGYWGLRTAPYAGPQRTLHIVPAYPGDGITIAGGGGQDPALQLANNPSLPNSNARAWLGLVNANGQFVGGSLGNDVVLLTSGANPGRLAFGTADALRVIIDQVGNTSWHSSHYGVRFAIKSTSPGNAGGIRLYDTSNDGIWFAQYIDGSNNFNLMSDAGYGFTFHRFSHFYPNTNGGAQLGGPGSYWSVLYTNYIGLYIGGVAPSYRLHLGEDSALKPGTATWTNPSDARSKDPKSIQAFGDGLAVVKRLHPIRYRYNGDFATPKDAAFVGFAAEELVEIAPEMVQRATMKRRAEDDEAVEMLAVNLHPLFFLLVNAVKELAERVDQLEGSAA